MKQSYSSLTKVAGKKGRYNIRPYTYNPRDILRAQLFEEDSNEISLMPREVVLVKARTLLGIVAPTLFPAKL